MKLRAITLFFISLFTALLPLGAVDRSLFLDNGKSHLVLRPENGIVIDWTSGYAAARSTVKLPRIVFNERNPDFGRPGTVMTLSEARTVSRQQARELASLKLMDTLLSLRLDWRDTIHDKMSKDENLTDRMGSVRSLFVTKSENTGEGYVSVEMAIPFYDRDGLLSLVADRKSYEKEEVPVIEESSVTDRMSGIIINLTDFPDFEPLLEPRLYTDQGRLIYGPEMLSRSRAIRRGLVTYHTSEEKARHDPRAGLNPFYIYASTVQKGNIYLDSADIVRLLSSKYGREALVSGNVIFLVAEK